MRQEHQQERDQHAERPVEERSANEEEEQGEEEGEEERDLLRNLEPSWVSATPDGVPENAQQYHGLCLPHAAPGSPMCRTSSWLVQR